MEQTMWQRLTERSRRVLFFAQQEAAGRKHATVAAEHILLAVVREGDIVAARILERMSASIKQIRAELDRQMTPGEQSTTGEIPLAASADRVIEYAYEEARQLTNNYIGTEHLLLGLIREGMDNSRELTGRALRNAGVDLDQTRKEVLALQDDDSGYKPAAPASPPAKQDAAPPHGPRAFASSRLAAAVFEREYLKLTPERQAQMQSEGLPVHQLTGIMQEILRYAAQAANQDNVQIVRSPQGMMRVQVETSPDGVRYNVASEATLVTTLLVRDDAP